MAWGWNIIISISDLLEKHIAAITAVIAVAAVVQWRESRKASERQLRAYLSVVIGQGGHIQDRPNGVRFEGSPIIRNSGQTPAYKVRLWHRAEVLPNNVIPNFDFTIVETNETSEATIGPQETRHMRVVVPGLIADVDVHGAQYGVGPCLWIWGLIKYEDAFGYARFTKFCQRLYWLHGGTVEGEYSKRYSGSD